MRVALLLTSFLSLSIVSVAPQQVDTGSTPASNSAGHGEQRVNGFLRVDGLKLLDGDGKQVYFSGMNYWSAMNLAADEAAGGNISRFNTEIEQLAQAGVNMVRIMASSEGAPTIQPFGMYPALMEAPDQWNEDIFVGLDRAVDKIAKAGMRAILTLSNTWNWSGGFGQYVSWANNNEQIPYPPSWDPTLNPPYGDYTTNGTWDGYTAYAIQFYTTASAQQLYRDHITKVMTRKNTVNGLSYNEDPSIIWEIANEPQPGWPEGWIEDVASFIKSHTQKQLVTTGFEGKQGEAAWKEANGAKSVDFACAHWWVQNQGIYNMTDPSAANLQAAIDSFTQYAANISQWAKDINKPVLVEEFGMARDNWENVAKGAPNSSYLYDASASIKNRDTYFRHVITTSLQYFLNGSAIIGTAAWAYGGIWRPGHARNQFNELWAGDPPHEAPGWYDVYSTDQTTLDLIAEQAKNASTAISANKTNESTTTVNTPQTGSAARITLLWR